MSKNRLSRRTKARRRAVDTVYEANLKGLDEDPEDLRQLVAERRQLSTAQTTLPDYSAEIVNGVADRLFDIDMTQRIGLWIGCLNRIWRFYAVQFGKSSTMTMYPGRLR